MKNRKKTPLIAGIIVLFLAVAGAGFAIYTQAVVKPRQLKWEEKVYPYVSNLRQTIFKENAIKVKNVKFYDISGIKNTDPLSDEDIDALQAMQNYDTADSLFCLIEIDAVKDEPKYFLYFTEKAGFPSLAAHLRALSEFDFSFPGASNMEINARKAIRAMNILNLEVGDVNISRINDNLE